MAGELIPLADAIEALREQLIAANKSGRDQALRFEVGPVEIELNMVVQREAKAGGKINFSIFGWGADASAEGSRSDERTHKVTITLTPVIYEQAAGPKKGRSRKRVVLVRPV